MPVRLMGRGNGPCPRTTQLSSDTPLVHLDLYTLGSSSLLPVHEVCMVRSQDIWRVEQLHSPRLMFWVSSRLPSLPDSQNTCWSSQSGVIWVSLPSSGALGWRAWHGGKTLCLGVTFAAEISLPNLSHCIWIWGPSFSCLHPSYQTQWDFSVNPWL